MTNKEFLTAQKEKANAQLTDLLNNGIETIVAEKVRAYEEQVRAEEQAKYESNIAQIKAKVEVIDDLIAAANEEEIESVVEVASGEEENVETNY